MKLLHKIFNYFDKLSKADQELARKDFFRVDNIRQVFNVSTSSATEIIKRGINDGVFKEIYLVYSPRENVIISVFDSREKIPNIVYDLEHEEDLEYAFVKQRDEARLLEVAYRYV